MVRTYGGSASGAAIHHGRRRCGGGRTRHPKQPGGGADRSAPGYDQRVTDRGPLDAPLACPFLAFEDDRDGRSLRPDHRHRCFAEVRPAPRAIAHQERYCLTPAFTTCPTFLDWARREAAVVREPSGGEAARGVATQSSVAPAGERRGSIAVGAAADAAPGTGPAGERDWAAPPPWAGGRVPAEPAAPVPPFLTSRGGSADEPVGAPNEPAALWSGSPGRAGSSERAGSPAGDAGGWVTGEEADATRPVDPLRRRSDRSPSEVPPWERPRRSEAYPRLRTRMGLPSVPPLLLAAAAVLAAAVALFFLPPMLLDLGRAAPSPSPSPPLASPSVAVAPSPSPIPTPLVYTVQAGDTLSKIAKRFGVSLDALIAANKDTIPNPDRIKIGDQIIIPTPPPDVIPGGSSPNPSGEAASPSP